MHYVETRGSCLYQCIGTGSNADLVLKQLILQSYTSLCYLHFTLLSSVTLELVSEYEKNIILTRWSCQLQSSHSLLMCV